MKIQGVISDPISVRYNYRTVGYTRANGYMHEEQDLTTILLLDGTVLTRWNKIPRQFVVSDRATFLKARKDKYYKIFGNWITADKIPSRNRMRHCMKEIIEFAQIGETVQFEGNVINNKIKGRIRAIARKEKENEI